MFRSHSAAAALRRVALPLSIVLTTSAPALADTPQLTLDEAIAQAVRHGPDVAVGTARIGLSEATLTGASVFPANPGLSLGAGGRFGLAGDGLGLDASVGVEQALPVFGRWGKGIDAARSRLDAAKLGFDARRAQIATAVALTYIDAQRWRAQLDVSDKRITLLTEVVATTQRQLAAGKGTLLDVTLWEAELGQAEGRRAQLEAGYARARVRLAVLTGAPPASAPVPADSLSLDGLSGLSASKGERPDLIARRGQVEAADKSVAEAQASGWPDLTVSAGASTEGAAWQQAGPAGDLVAGAGLSVPLPLFARNQGDIAAARATGDVERAELDRATLLAQAEVVSAEAALSAALRAARILKTRVVDKQTSSLALLRKAYDAGKLGVTDVLLRQRSVLDAESAYVAALADVAVAQLQLASATGALAGHVRTLLATATEVQR